MASTPADQMIGERHSRSISRWVLVAGVASGSFGLFVRSVSGLSGLAGVLVFIVVAALTMFFLTRIVVGLHARSFLRQYLTAELRLEPSRREPLAIDPLLDQQGFHQYGSWMVTGGDVVFAGAGSRLYYQDDTFTSVYMDSAQTVVSSALNDGRVLLTVSVGAVPCPRFIIQGIKNADVAELLRCHRDGLTVLAADNVSAIEPQGGPVDFHLLSERMEQEWLAGQPERRAAATLLLLANQELVQLSDTPPNGSDRVPV